MDTAAIIYLVDTAATIFVSGYNYNIHYCILYTFLYKNIESTSKIHIKTNHSFRDILPTSEAKKKEKIFRRKRKTRIIPAAMAVAFGNADGGAVLTGPRFLASGGVTARPTRRYCPPRSNRFIELIAS